MKRIEEEDRTREEILEEIKVSNIVSGVVCIVTVLYFVYCLVFK